MRRIRKKRRAGGNSSPGGVTRARKAATSAPARDSSCNILHTHTRARAHSHTHTRTHRRTHTAIMHTCPFQFSRVRFFNDYMVAFLTQGGRESRLTRLLLPACQVASLSSVRAVRTPWCPARNQSHSIGLGSWPHHEARMCGRHHAPTLGRAGTRAHGALWRVRLLHVGDRHAVVCGIRIRLLFCGAQKHR
jgi:hypothetical protein